MIRNVLSVSMLTVLAASGFAQEMPEKTKDFGPSSIGPVLIHYFPIENTSKVEVRVGAPRIGCGCVSAQVLKGVLAPGEKTFLAVQMDTKKIPANQRNVTKTVSVNVPFTAAGRLSEAKVDVTCVGREDMSLSPEILAMGDVKIGGTATAKTTITLFSNVVWDVKEAKSTGQFVKAEVKKLPGKPGQIGTTYEVSATLLDNCPAGNWMSDVFLKSTTPGLESYRIPVTVNVKAAIAAEPASLKLGDVQLPAGSTVGPRPRITVNGLSPFKILEVKTGDKQISAKVIYDDARSSHVIELQLTPEKDGEFTQNVEIVTDCKEMKSVIVPVSATVKK